MRLVYEHLTDIPSNFTEVEYLESSGTQYIDVPYMPKDTSGMRAVWSHANNTDSVIAGARKSVGSDNRWFIGHYSSGLYFGWNTLISTTPTTNGTFYDCKLNFYNDRKAYIDGVEKATISSTLTTTDMAQMKLFYVVNAGAKMTGKLKLCQVTEGDKLIYDFVPCLDNNNVPCMYDKVQGKAYYNAGTGSFTYGRKIIPVEYLESSGTQYIDTGLKGKSGISAKTKVNYTYLSGSASHAIGGEYTTNTSCYFGMVRANGHFTYLYKNSVVETTTTLSTNTDYDIDITLNNGNQKFVINGNVVSTGTVSGDFTSTNNLFLYAINSVNGADVYGSLKMYYMQISDNGTLVRDYIPCKDENNVGFMFDRVTHSVYLNAGTGSFTFGKTLPKKKLRLLMDSKRRLPKNFREVEYLESSGTQYIDTGVFPTQLTKAKIEMQFTNVNYKQAVLGSNNGASGDAGWNNLFGTNENSSTAKPTYFWCQWGNSFDGPVTKDTNRHTHTFERNGNSSWTYTIDNASKTITSGISTQTNPKVLYLFACNNNGTLYRQAKVKVYRCQIWNNGTPVRDFIPCLDISNVPCMYDLVENKAYYNAGTGSFNYGHTITPINYLESSGTQYIDTGYIPTNTTGQYAKMKYTTVDRGVTFGGMISGNGVVGPYYAASSGSYWWTRWGTNEPKIEASSPTTTDTYEMYLNFNNDRVAKVNNIVISNSLGNISGNYPSLTLFRRNFSAGYAYLSGKIYKYQITEGTSLVRDYIPVKDENNVGYMFDKVTHSLYANAGTGTFVVGSELKDITRFLKGA